MSRTKKKVETEEKEVEESVVDLVDLLDFGSVKFPHEIFVDGDLDMARLAGYTYRDCGVFFSEDKKIKRVILFSKV